MIRIQNIYYMLSYAFQVLNEQSYRNVATEDFNNVAELCAAILVRGVSAQIRRGLGKEYMPRAEALSTLRGRINISETLKTQEKPGRKSCAGFWCSLAMCVLWICI